MSKAWRTKPRTAWLITWESPRNDYLEDLNRPRVVCVLSAKLTSKTIERILPALWLSESILTFSEKINFAMDRKLTKRWLRSDGPDITYGPNPWLRARIVEQLRAYGDDTNVETIQWVEPERVLRENESLKIGRIIPGKSVSLTKDFS